MPEEIKRLIFWVVVSILVVILVVLLVLKIKSKDVQDKMYRRTITKNELC